MLLSSITDTLFSFSMIYCFSNSFIVKIVTFLLNDLRDNLFGFLIFINKMEESWDTWLVLLVLLGNDISWVVIGAVHASFWALAREQSSMILEQSYLLFDSLIMNITVIIRFGKEVQTLWYIALIINRWYRFNDI
jgi:hypothetical protein